MLRRLVAPLLVLSLVGMAGPIRTSNAAPATGKYLVDAGGKIGAVRVIDTDGDGRLDLIALVETKAGDTELVIFRTPATPTKRSLFPADHITRIPCTGPRASAGAVAVGRFGPKGAVRLRFFGPRGVEDVKPDGSPAGEPPPRSGPSLLARSAGRSLVFWDAVADLDADGIDECWHPLAEGDGPIRILGGTPAGDRLLSIGANNQASSTGVQRLLRSAYVPNLFPADLDGDGMLDLVALQEKHLVGWSLRTPPTEGKVLEPWYRLHLPFLEPDPELAADALRTPRIQLEDIDGDGVADLLVTLITGVRTKLVSIRTILFHYPGPFRNAKSGLLTKPKTRIDTQSIVLHPTFVDLDHDGAKDYVGDSIRGTMMDLIARLMGQDPKVTLVGFRYDKKLGTFAPAPWFTSEHAYASKQALNNEFGRSGWLTGDFDGDGRNDLLDLGNLTSAQILGGSVTGSQVVFDQVLMPPVPVKEGLAPHAQVADLNADGRADAVLWSSDKLYVILSAGKAR